MMRVLSREAVKIMSGFSAEVAMAVTSPLLVVAVVVSVVREARCGERERESKSERREQDQLLPRLVARAEIGCSTHLWPTSLL